MRSGGSRKSARREGVTINVPLTALPGAGRAKCKKVRRATPAVVQAAALVTPRRDLDTAFAIENAYVTRVLGKRSAVEIKDIGQCLVEAHRLAEEAGVKGITMPEQWTTCDAVELMASNYDNGQLMNKKIIYLNELCSFDTGIAAKLRRVVSEKEHTYKVLYESKMPGFDLATYRVSPATSRSRRSTRSGIRSASRAPSKPDEGAPRRDFFQGTDSTYTRNAAAQPTAAPPSLDTSASTASSTRTLVRPRTTPWTTQRGVRSKITPRRGTRRQRALPCAS
jgi:hypothetical protein